MKTQHQIKKIVDKIVQNVLFGTAILSASFIVLIVIVILERGITPFITDSEISFDIIPALICH